MTAPSTLKRPRMQVRVFFPGAPCSCHGKMR